MDWSPFWISLRVAGLATLLTIILGSLIAWPLARSRFRGRDLAIGVVNLPLALPPTVLGYALLVGLGRRSVVGGWYESLTGRTLVFTWEGAAVAACVASLPLFVSQARIAIAAVESEVVGAARTDGASGWPLVRFIFLPLAWPGLLAGAALAFARALGDFGATLMVAGDTPGVTQTMPIAIYDAVLSGDTATVQAFALLSAGLCLGVTVLAARLGRAA